MPTNDPVARADDTPDDRAELSAELEQLRAEVARLRALVGPDEKSYRDLQYDILKTRDYAIGVEAEAAEAWSRLEASEALSLARHEHILHLESEVQRLGLVYASRSYKLGRAVVRPLSVLRSR